jgi:hypothetical protein
MMAKWKIRTITVAGIGKVVLQARFSGYNKRWMAYYITPGCVPRVADLVTSLTPEEAIGKAEAFVLAMSTK